jgi:tetratricopeptide (TPR) repeat protein
MESHRGRIRTGVLVALSVCASAAIAQQPKEIPHESVRDWMFYSDAGLKALRRGDLAKAEQRYHAAIKAVKPYEGSASRLMAKSYTDLSWVLYREKRYAEAEPLATWALEIRQKHPGVKPEAVFHSLYVTALIDRELRRYDKAEVLLTRRLDLQEKALGPNHLEVAQTLDDLAGIYGDQGKDREADPFYRRALAVRELVGPNSAELADTLEHYAASLRRQKRDTAAEPLEARARTIRIALAEKEDRIKAAIKAAESKTQRGFQTPR